MKDYAPSLILHHYRSIMSSTLEQLYNGEKYSNILDYCEAKLDKITIEDKYFLGLTLFEIGHYDYALKILEEILRCSYKKDTSKLFLYLAFIKYMHGDYKRARKHFNSSILMNGSFSKEAINWKNLLDIDDAITHYKYTNSNIIYRFVDAFNDFEINQFIIRYRKAYNRISSFFMSKMKKKIDVYIYRGRYDILGNNLSYANPPLSTIHVNLYEDCGHELTHILSYHIEPKSEFNSKFFSEGIAEYFDDTKKEYSFHDKDLNIDVFDLWDNFDKYPAELAYACAKVFFANLLRHLDYDRNTVIQLLRKPSIANAYEVLGICLNGIKQETEYQIANHQFI